MSKQREREEFIAKITAERVPVDVARKLMRAAATLHRLAEMECNGYGWEDHFKRFACPNAADATAGCDLCGRVEAGAPHYETTQGALYLVRTDAQVRARVERLCAPYGVKPVFQGDPRGAVLKLVVPSGKTDDWGQTGVCVPS